MIDDHSRYAYVEQHSGREGDSAFDADLKRRLIFVEPRYLRLDSLDRLSRRMPRFGLFREKESRAGCSPKLGSVSSTIDLGGCSFSGLRRSARRATVSKRLGLPVQPLNQVISDALVGKTSGNSQRDTTKISAEDQSRSAAAVISVAIPTSSSSARPA